MNQSLRNVLLCMSILTSSLISPFDGSAFRDMDKGLKTMAYIIFGAGIFTGAAAYIIVKKVFKK